jgi:hypothetical protein
MYTTTVSGSWMTGKYAHSKQEEVVMVMRMMINTGTEHAELSFPSKCFAP